VSNCENYYDILNVGKFATQNEISTMYNHLVEIFSHKNCNNKRCEDAFKKVEKAYEIWSDSEKRFEFIHNCTRKQFDVIEHVLNNFNYYNILGVESNATYIEIKQKCKQLFELMQKCKQLFELMQKCKAKESEKVFKKINEAYDVLCNKDKRLDYDIKQNEILKRVLKDDDYYKILDVSVNANNNEIETEHKKLTNTIIHLKLEAETKKLVYEKVQNAYENLRNSEKRFFYDKKCNRYQYDMIEQVRSNNKSFKILGVKSNANKQEINRRFEELKDAIHPSKCKAENSREAFEKVQFAYVTLMNRRKRSCMNCCRRVGKFLRKISPYNRWIFLSLFTVAVLIFLSWLFLVFVLNYGGRSYLTEVTNSTEIANITDENIVTDVSFITNFTEVIPVTNFTNENNVTDASNVTNLTEATTVTIVTELSESTIVTEITNVTDLNDITDQNNVTNNANEIAVTDSDEVSISYDLSDVNDVNDKNNFNIVSTDDFKETVESN
jgi:DnaJ-class molecular chaperone